MRIPFGYDTGRKIPSKQNQLSDGKEAGEIMWEKLVNGRMSV
jgi:hypothetical protein